MKNKLLSVAFIFVSAIVSGQSCKITPSKTVTVLAPYSDTSKFEIYFENISDNTVTLHWELISNKLVAGWDCFICDNVSCCVGVPQKGTLPYIDPGIEVYLALNVNPKTIPGEGTLKLYVYEDGNPTGGDTLTWIVNSSPTGINDIRVNSDIAVFPNPVSDYATIDLYSSPLKEMNNVLCIYNSTGEKILEKNIYTHSALEKLDVTVLPKGIYLLVLKGKDGSQLPKTFIKQ